MSDYSGGQFLRLPMWLTDYVIIPEGLIPSGAKACLLVIIRKTIGYDKKSDAISVSQFKKLTRLCNQTILDSCEYLVNKGFAERKKGPRNTWIYSLAEKRKIMELMDALAQEKESKPKRKIKRKNNSTILPNRTMTVLSDRTVSVLPNRTEVSEEQTKKKAVNNSTILPNRTMTVLSDRNTIDINRYIYINIYRSLVRTFKVGEAGYFEEIKPIDESEKTLLVEVKPKPKAKKKIIYEERDFKCAEWMLSRVNTALLSIGYKDTQANLEKWANTIRLMRTQDKHSYKEIFELFNWANSDEFWKINIRSPDKLRKQWVELNVRRHKEISKVKTLRSNSSSTSWVDSNTQALANALFMEPANNPLLPTIEELESNLLTGKNGV